MKFGMKIAVEMSNPATDHLAKLQFVSNGFIVVPSDESDVIITDNKSRVEMHHSTGKKVLVQLLDLSPAVREVAEIPHSDRFAFFDIEGNGFGAFSGTIDFLRRSPQTVGG